MFDPDTLIVTYDAARGEPRALRRKGEEPKGDCIDCGICIQVCPTGVDIRNGLQYECIGCAVCIDACDLIMDKVNLPRGLVRYTTENALKQGWGASEIFRHILRPRTLIYGTILLVIITAFIWGLFTRIPLRVDVLRDPSLGRFEGALIVNDYTLKIMNMTEKERTYTISVDGLEGIRLVGDSKRITNGNQATAEPTENLEVLVEVKAPRESGKPGANRFYFEIVSKDDPSVKRREKATFLYPN
jgi:cytochrome c oxidase accessory protein FixG